MRVQRIASLAVLFALASACGKKAAAPETTLSGTAALTSYPSAPSAVLATDESGRSIRTSLGAAGAFSLTLPAGHKYKISVATAKGNVPLVFPRTGGALDGAFSVKSKGANVALGSVRYLARAPVTGFTMATSPAGASGANCENCADDHQDVSCEDGSQGHDDAESSAAEAVDQADANQEMSVADHNAPDGVNGCDDNESNDDSNNDNR